MTQVTHTELAKVAWQAYAKQARNKTFDGKPLPTWAKLGDDRQYCWLAAVAAVADAIDGRENVVFGA